MLVAYSYFPRKYSSGFHRLISLIMWSIHLMLKTELAQSSSNISFYFLMLEMLLSGIGYYFTWLLCTPWHSGILDSDWPISAFSSQISPDVLRHPLELSISKYWNMRYFQNYLSMVLRSLAIDLRSAKKLRSLEKFCIRLRNFVYSFPWKNFLFSRKKFAFPRDTLFTWKMFAFPRETEKLCSLAKYLFLREILFSHKMFGLPWKTLCLLAKFVFPG